MSWAKAKKLKEDEDLIQIGMNLQMLEGPR